MLKRKQSQQKKTRNLSPLRVTETEKYGPLAHMYVSINVFNAVWERAVSHRRLPLHPQRTMSPCEEGFRSYSRKSVTEKASRPGSGCTHLCLPSSPQHSTCVSASGLREEQALCFVGSTFCSNAGNCLFSLALPKSPWQGD